MADDSPLDAAMAGEDQSFPAPDTEDIFGNMMDRMNQGADLHSKILDNRQKDIQNQGSLSSLRNKNVLANALSTFLFSYGQAEAARAQAAPGRGGSAAMGAGLQAPMQLQQMRMQQQALQQERQNQALMAQAALGRAGAAQQNAATNQQKNMRIPVTKDPDTGLIKQITDPSQIDDKTFWLLPSDLGKVYDSTLSSITRSDIASKNQAAINARQYNSFDFKRNLQQVIQDARASNIQSQQDFASKVNQLKNDFTAKENDLNRQNRIDVANINAGGKGTTVIGPDGKVLQLKPGDIAPPGFTTPQQAGAANAAETKAAIPAQQAVKYGRDYLDSGQFTGPKDEALLEAFFEVAKPSSGFRMSQPQIDMLMKARSWMQSAEGQAYHAQSGVWFPPQQRQQIVEAMEARAASKAPAPAPKPTQGGMVKMQKPDGSIVNVPTANVPAALKLGGKMVQ